MRGVPHHEVQEQDAALSLTAPSACRNTVARYFVLEIDSGPYSTPPATCGSIRAGLGHERAWLMKRVFGVVTAAIALAGFLTTANASIVRVSYTGTAQGEIDHSVLPTGSTFQMLLDFASSTSDASGISGLAVPRLYLNGTQLAIPGASAISYASALTHFSFNAYTTTDYPLPPTEENPLIQSNVSHFLNFFAPLQLVPGPGASYPYFASTTPCPSCAFFTKDTTDHYATFINGEWVNEFTIWDTPTAVDLQVGTLSIAAAVPEPSTWALMLLGCVMLFASRAAERLRAT